MMWRGKWFEVCLDVSSGRETTCPECGGHNFNLAFIAPKVNSDYGWGAVWCEDCRSAFVLSRVILTDETAREKIIPALPDDLKFIKEEL